MNGAKKTTKAITVRGDRVLHSLRLIRGSFMTIADALGDLIGELELEGGKLPELLEVPRPFAVDGPEGAQALEVRRGPLGIPLPRPAPVAIGPQTRCTIEGLTAGEAAIVSVLAAGEVLHRDRVALRALQSRSSGGFAQSLANLRAGEVLEDGPGGLALTPTWLERARALAPMVPPPGPELAEAWARKLEGRTRGAGQAAAIRFLSSASRGPSGPAVVTRNELAAELDRSPTSGGFAQTLADLRRVGLLEDVPGGLRLSRDLVFPD